MLPQIRISETSKSKIKEKNSIFHKQKLIVKAAFELVCEPAYLCENYKDLLVNRKGLQELISSVNIINSQTLTRSLSFHIILSFRIDLSVGRSFINTTGQIKTEETLC